MMQEETFCSKGFGPSNDHALKFNLHFLQDFYMLDVERRRPKRYLIFWGVTCVTVAIKLRLHSAHVDDLTCTFMYSNT